MRLIDADALRESLFESSQFDTYNDYSMVLDRIDLSSTIEEQKKGKWLFNPDPRCGDFICSECLERNIECTNYCPNCGAEMEGEE